MEDPPHSPGGNLTAIQLQIDHTSAQHGFPNNCNHFNNNPGKLYSPTNIALERDFAYWASQVKNLLRLVELLEDENKQLHAEVSDLKQLVSKMKIQENLQEPIADFKSMQENMRSQHDLLKQEIKTY